MMETAVLTRPNFKSKYQELFPDYRIFALGEPKLGYRFQRVLVFLEPKDDREIEWVNNFSMALPPEKKLELFI